MELNVEQVRERVLHLSHTYDGKDSACIDEIKNLLDRLPKGNYEFLRDISDKVKFHPKIFYLFNVKFQLRNLDKIQHLMGTEENPNHEAIDVFIKIIKNTTLEEQEELQDKVSQWVLLYVSRERGKSVHLLEEKLSQDFLSSDLFYERHHRRFISKREYRDLKVKFIQNYIQNRTNIKDNPDLQQSEAICTLNKNVQVVARAGSGKTTTLVSRALFLQKHCGVSPNDILLLAFNRSASQKIEEDLKEQLTDTLPHVMTFHALAYAIATKTGELCYDNPDGGQEQSRLIQKVIYDHLRDPQIYERIKKLMMARFKRDWETIEKGGFNKEPKEFLRYRRSLPKLALDGRHYKSFGEKTIANFLFEHNLPYLYEKEYLWNGRSYRPDFSIFPKGESESRKIILEYFGLQGDVDYDSISSEKRKYWRNNQRFHFLEFTPRDYPC
ncbi:UvrD-helicase domain-containing protein [Halomicronema sp. CCY15110]|uniref:UvrD-helicase domain-containing protein n=1 Tax=Halomicronema sp. CCY15110 TaxID=2767773 RepID=UPI001950FF34|nr:UvrD-helicase domain-containing protein [Halomicronema sp. CCY15110]